MVYFTSKFLLDYPFSPTVAMKKPIHFWMLLSVLMFSLGFIQDTPYETTIRTWQKKRVENLKSEEGWLNLAGLFWLEEGENTVGGDNQNDLVFPSQQSADFLGKIILDKGKVTFVSKREGLVFAGDQAIQETVLFPYDGKPTVLRHGSLRWFVIQRGEKYAVRLRDLESEYLKNFTGIPTYPIDSRWRLKTRFIPTPGRMLTILDITGRTFQQPSLGKLAFTINGKEYALETTGPMERLSVIFADASNKKETYGAGRYLEAEKPDENGMIYLDFNKAYNPPCAFTPFATCPLPTKENTLPIAIPAGEKYAGDH